jgi:hypothetical protein
MSGVSFFALSVMRLGWLEFGYGTARPIPWWWWLGSLGVTGIALFVVHRRTSPGRRGASPTH